MTTGIGGDILVSDEVLDWITYAENYGEFECEACHRSLDAITPGATLRTIIRAAELHMAVCND